MSRKRKYPRVGRIETVRPQGKCFLCDKIELEGKRPEKRIHIQWNWFRGEDDVFKAHGKCVDVLSQEDLLKYLTEPQNV